uniref:TlpA family protein disulfide reductase n=1 Tax=Pedobacter schmidteae TaxID=2201271 RepID=UPI000EB3599A|nr:TlpA disulfide reductase family protein [Pedobacter schmidteae]
MKTIKIKWAGMLLAALLPGLLQAQQVFTLSGKLGKLNAPARLYIEYYDYANRKPVRTSVSLKDGTFFYKGIAVNEPTSVELILSHDGVTADSLKNRSYRFDETLDHMDKTNLLVQNGANVITAVDSVKRILIAPSTLELQRRLFADFVKVEKMKMTALNKSWVAMMKDKQSGKQVDEQEYLSTLMELFAAEKAYEDQCILFAKKYPNKYYALVALSSALQGSGRFERLQDERMYEAALKIKKAFSGLAPTLKKSLRAEGIKYRYDETLAHKKTGVKATNFIQHTAGGKAVGLTDFKGKYVFVDFWASWCGPCRGENPNVLRAYNSYKDVGLEILGVSFDDKKEAWMKAVKEDQMPWTQISTLKGFENEAAKLYNVTGIPASLLINPEGEIIGYDLRGENLEKKLLEVFKK